jgi:hypothetical protein
MLASNVDELVLLITAANGWRTAGISAGVTISQLNASFNNGGMVVLRWDDAANEWAITAN